MAGWILDTFCWPWWNLLSPVLRLKSKPKSITFTGESTDGVKKSTFSGFKSRCKTPGHSGGRHTNVYNLGKQSGGFESLPKKGTCFTQNERNPLQGHLIILKSLASSPSSLNCKLYASCFFGFFLNTCSSCSLFLYWFTFNWKQHHKPQKLPLQSLVNLMAPQTNVTVCSFKGGGSLDTNLSEILPRWWQ